MDEYRYKNDYSDYSRQNVSLYLWDGYFNDALLSSIRSKESTFGNVLDKVLPAFIPESGTDYSIYTGYCGLAYYLYLKFLKTENPDLKDYVPTTENHRGASSTKDAHVINTVRFFS